MFFKLSYTIEDIVSLIFKNTELESYNGDVKVMCLYVTLPLQNWKEEATQNGRNLSNYCDLVESNALRRIASRYMSI